MNRLAGFPSAAQYQLFQIQEMLWLKMLPGPLVGWRQLDPDEIADLPVDTVTHNSGQIIAGTVHIHMRTYGHRYLELQTHPGWRDILQQSGRFTYAARWFLPTDLYHIGA